MKNSSAPNPSPVSPPTPPAEAPQGPGDLLRDQRAGLWAALVRAIDAARLYDADHPQVRDRASEAERLYAALGPAEPRTFLVEPKALVPLDGSTGSSARETPAAEVRLAGVLHGLDAGSLRFGKNPTSADFEALAITVAHARTDGVDTAALLGIEHATDARLRVDPLDLSALTRNARAASADEASEINWASLVDCLLQPVARPGAEPAAGPRGTSSPAAAENTLAAAARSIADRVLDDPELGKWLLRHRLVQASKRIAETGPNPDPAQFEKLQAFAKELERCLGEQAAVAARGNLVGVGPGVRQSLMMCRALSTFEPSAASTAQEGWTKTVQDLLQDGSAQEHTPDAYLRRLEVLAARQDACWTRSAPPPLARPAKVNEAAFEPEAIDAQVLAVVLALAETKQGASATPVDVLGERLALALPRLAQAVAEEARTLLRIHAVLEDALSANQPDAAPAPEGPEGSPLAHAWATHLDTESTGAALAAALGDAAPGDPDAQTLRSVLEASGPSAMEGFLAACLSAAPSRCPLRHLGRDHLETLRLRWATERPAATTQLARALAPLSFSDARGLLGSQLRARNSRQRLSAFTTLFEVAPDWDAAFLQNMLADPDPGVRAMGLTNLLRQGPRQAERLEAIAGWVREQRPARGPALGEVIRGLAADPGGQGVLHHLLSQNLRGAGARRMRGFLAQTLRDLPDLPPGLNTAVHAALPEAEATFLGRVLRPFLRDKNDTEHAPRSAA